MSAHSSTLLFGFGIDVGVPEPGGKIETTRDEREGHAVEDLSGIEGMRKTLALHLERMRENPETIPYEWVQLANSYARLAELERDAVAVMAEAEPEGPDRLTGTTFTVWRRNGDHPRDGYDPAHPDREGYVVRRFRDPEVSGKSICPVCAKSVMIHGWIEPNSNDGDVTRSGQIVCPGDLVSENAPYRVLRRGTVDPSRIVMAERDTAFEKPRPHRDGIPGGPSSAWAEYLPHRVVRDSSDDEWFVMGYTHDGMPMLGGGRWDQSSTSRRFSAHTAEYCTDHFGPLVVTDSYMK